MYRVEARKNYLVLAKTKKRSKQKIRKTIRKQLGYVKRDLGKSKDIRLSGPKLGRPSKTNDYSKEIEYRDNVDRIEVERMFSLSKRCYNLGLIKTKLEVTTMTSIALSIFVTNLFKIQLHALFDFVWNFLFDDKSPSVLAV